MHRAGWLAIVLLMPLTAGCLGSVTPAEIPASTLNDEGWTEHSSSSGALAAGIGEKVTKEYRPTNDQGTTAVLVVSANDIPILDESRFIPQAIERIEDQRKIDLNRQGTVSLDLVNFDTPVDADEYTFQKGGANGKALVFTPDCDPFVVVAAYGITGAGGFDATTKTFQEAKNVSSHVVCG